MFTTQFNVKSVNSEAVAARPREPNSILEQTTTQIRIARSSDQKYIIASMVLAFNNDPVARWMYPDSYQYLTHFPNFIRAFGGRSFEQNTTYAVDGYSGAALWFPPGVEPNVDALIELFQRSVFEAQQEDLFSVLEQMGHYHPKQSHWYLAILGVEPVQQRKGYGSALMQPVLTRCDRDRIPAYLESSNPANIPFYEHHGFELLGTIQVGASPPIFPMVRYPQS
ncbi:GNAT family N-acetyltransferase [Pleurocapsales cyanobacterium LEGE 06147]|nr:GNAT family N-acetyltransferase [Pleurocapsales cyanobacterium LEGE 06147]